MSDISQNESTPTESGLFGFLRKLRRQFTGAGDWKSAITNSELPPEAQSTITTLIKQTKLMRFEKFEIADELIAHFVDGLERGKKIDELTSVFGDPEVAAALFRSSKLRSRPMAIKAGKFTFWTMLAAGGSYLGLLAFYHMASPTPNVDYSVAMNRAAAAVPEDQRAWLVYRDAWTKFEFSEGGGEQRRFDEIFTKDDDGKQTRELIRPEDEGWDRAVEKIRTSSELLDALRAAYKFDYFGLELHNDISDYSEKDFLALFPHKDYETEKQNADTFAKTFGVVEINEEADQLLGESLVNILLPHVQSLRHAARILQVDTRLATTENDPNRVVENISAILGFARQQNNESILVCKLVGIAIFKMAVAQVEEVLHDSPGLLQDTHLSQLQNVIQEFDFTKIDVTAEQTFQRDILQRVYTDDGNGGGHLTAAGLEIIAVFKQWNSESNNRYQADSLLWHQHTPLVRSLLGPALMLGSPGRREVTSELDALTEAAKSRFGTPWWEDDLSDLDQWEPSLLMLAPKWGEINASHQIAIAHQDAGLLGIAIERYRLKFDSWPQSIDDLEGEFLSKIPLDRVTGEPLLFNASDQSVTIYSVGGDQDDDGGTHDARTIPLAATYDPSVDGDWVLWPMDRD